MTTAPPIVEHSKTRPAQADSKYAWAAVALSVVVTAIRVLLARPVSFCGTPDACFYLGMAQNLASGQGFHARFLYDFQQAHPTLPNTGIEYWRPGISLLLVLLRPLGGVTLHGSIVLTTMVGVLFSAAAWHIAIQTYDDRRLALGGFSLCLLSSSVWIGSGSPDSGLYYGAAVAWFLALFRVRRSGVLQDIAALVCVSVAYLIRNDAVLLVVPLVAVLWSRSRDADDRPHGRTGTSVTGYQVMLLVGFFVALAPMHLLYKHVLGIAFPSGTAQALFLNDLSDFGRYRDPVSLHSLLGHGIKHLVLFRVSTLATVLYRVAVLMIGYPALVFLPGLLPPRDQVTSPDDKGSVRTRLPEAVGPVSFALVTLFVYGLVLPAIGGFSALRTAVGLMPLASVLVIVAIARVCRTPTLVFWVSAGVIAANALAGFMEIRRDVPTANQIGEADRAEAIGLKDLGADPFHAIVLTNDPVQFAVTTGFATIVLPSNGLDAIAQAARDFHVTHVILDSTSLPASRDVVEQRLHPVRALNLAREHSLILELPQTGPSR